MRVFLSHPYKSNPKLNKEKADMIAKYMARKGITPISPLHLFSFYDDDANRAEVMSVCEDLIDICQEVWVYGDSKGCMEELNYAVKQDIPVKIMFLVMDYDVIMRGSS